MVFQFPVPVIGSLVSHGRTLPRDSYSHSFDESFRAWRGSGRRLPSYWPSQGACGAHGGSQGAVSTGGTLTMSRAATPRSPQTRKSTRLARIPPGSPVPHEKWPPMTAETALAPVNRETHVRRKQVDYRLLAKMGERVSQRSAGDLHHSFERLVQLQDQED